MKLIGLNLLSFRFAFCAIPSLVVIRELRLTHYRPQGDDISELWILVWVVQNFSKPLLNLLGYLK